MGRGRGRGRRAPRQRQDFKTPRENQWRDNTGSQRDGYQMVEMKNEKFEAYYKEQNICPPEEWDQLMETLRRPLPLTFRINTTGKFANQLRSKLETDFMGHFAQGEVIVDGEPVEAPHPLPWYPHNYGWQMNFSRNQLRKEPVLEALHEFMKRENSIGAISRQEAVSMVPPLFMDVKPNHRVLDMCAAPGSKTFQLLEALHAGPEPATGLVIANDADIQRCNLLTHQTQRMRSPALVVTNHEAQFFPLLHDLDPNSTGKYYNFDRVLCDVPCSGDGTMRKQPDIWRRWGVGQGNGLHNLQLRITLRACELLKVGGRLVYSTCTFNPIEDEAVVADVLKRMGGAMELLDVSDELPNLKRAPGIKTWKVMDKEQWYSTWEEASADKHKLDPTMFSDEETQKLLLERCMRFLPHYQNTGGFFVAVLKKVAPLPAFQMPSTDHRAGHKRQKGNNNGGQQQQPAKKRKEGEEGAAAAAAGDGAQLERKPTPDAIEVDTEAAATTADDEAATATATATETATEAVANGAAAEPTEATTATETEGTTATVKEAEATRESKPVIKAMPQWGVRGGGGRNREGGKYKGIDPIVPYIAAEEVKTIREYYGISEDCPIPDNLISRSEDHNPKKLSFISPGVKTLLQMDVNERLKITYAGLKILERQDTRGGLIATRYRLAQESVPEVLPHMTKQRFYPSVSELLALLHDRAVSVPEDLKLGLHRPQTTAAEAESVAAVEEEEMKAEAPVAAEAAKEEEAEAPIAAEGEEAKPATEAAPAAEGQKNNNNKKGGGGGGAGKQKGPPQAKRAFTDPRSIAEIAKLQYGCCVATVRDEDLKALGLENTGGGDVADVPLTIVCWRGNSVLNVMVAREECEHMAEKILAKVAQTGYKLQD